MAITGRATAASAPTAIASGERPFRVQFVQSKSPRGLAVQGHVYNPLPWRITAMSQTFDKVTLEVPAAQVP